MENEALKSKIGENVEIIKTLRRRAPGILGEVKSVQKEQKKYQDFLTKQSKGKYAYIETQSFSTV